FQRTDSGGAFADAGAIVQLQYRHFAERITGAECSAEVIGFHQVDIDNLDIGNAFFGDYHQYTTGIRGLRGAVQLHNGLRPDWKLSNLAGDSDLVNRPLCYGRLTQFFSFRGLYAERGRPGPDQRHEDWHARICCRYRGYTTRAVPDRGYSIATRR